MTMTGDHMARDYSFELSSGALRTMRNQPPSTFLLTFEKFSSLAAQNGKSSRILYYESPDFKADGYTWKLILYPNGEDGHNGYISIYLQIQDTTFSSTDWEAKVDMKLCAFKQDDNKFLMVQDLDAKCFNARRTRWGFARFLPLEAFNDPENGYLVNDKCEFGAEILVIGTKEPESPPGLGTTTPSKYSEIQRTIRALNPAHCIFMISSFSKLRNEGKLLHESDAFIAGGFKWKLTLYPKGREEGNKIDHISLYLRILETENFPEGWNVHAFFRFFIKNQNNGKYLTIQEPTAKEMKRFHKEEKEQGIDELLYFEDFSNPSNGYLVEDKCYFGAEVFVVNPTKGFMPVDDTYLWTIENFSKLKERGRFRVQSEGFYLGGTQWMLTLYSKGGNEVVKSKKLTMFLELLNAPKYEKWQLFGTLSFLDKATGNHISKSVNGDITYECKGWRLQNFISLEDMNEAKGYITEDDKVYVQVKFHSVIIKENSIKKAD